MHCGQGHSSTRSSVPKMQFLEVELYFNDASGFHARTQDILLGRREVVSADAAQAVQKTAPEQHAKILTSSLKTSAAQFTKYLTTMPKLQLMDV